MRNLKLVAVSVTVALAFGAAGCSSSPNGSSAAATGGSSSGQTAGPVTLTMGAWTYDTPKIQDNLKEFSAVEAQKTPAKTVSVDLSDADFSIYNEFIATRFSAGKGLDVFYGSDQWLSQWAAAGWAVPVEQYYPQLKDYTADLSKSAVNALTYKGQLYGLPYYADAMYFVYNKKLLDAAGISGPPTTWDQVTQDATSIKQKGLTDTPIEIGLAAGSWLDEVLYAMVYSNGGQMFDQNLKPVFGTSSGPFYDAVQWLAAALKNNLMPQSVLGLDAVDIETAFLAGTVAFAIIPGYMFSDLNDPSVSKIAGSADIALMPGSTHGTDAYTRLVLMGKGALENQATRDAAWDLVQFLGGKSTINGVIGYNIPKSWAVDNGLGFAATPLWNDPQVVAKFSKMVDVNTMKQQQQLAETKQGIQAPWYSEWISYVEQNIQNAIQGQASTASVLQGIQQYWLTLQSQYQ